MDGKPDVMKRRANHYPRRLSLALSDRTADTLAAASDRYRLAAGVIAREALVRGLPRTLESLRTRDWAWQEAEAEELGMEGQHENG